MANRASRRLIADRGAAITWDGETPAGHLADGQGAGVSPPTAPALHGLAAVAIRRSHHIGCLAVYLRGRPTRNLMAIVASSDPSEATMAPFGGVAAVFTPDPIAFGIPTDGDPILVDISASITTNGMTGRLRREGRRYPGLWAQDAEGRPTDDPAVLAATPPGSLLPTGGTDHGHKGYGLALAVEALTQGLAGHGRAEKPTTWMANVYVQVMDPGGLRRHRCFSARDELARQGLPRDAARPRRRGRSPAGPAGLVPPPRWIVRRAGALSGNHGRAHDLGHEATSDGTNGDQLDALLPLASRFTSARIQSRKARILGVLPRPSA